ncbi:MAG: tRNA (adenosine(37)-N6)-threonylcarbamoyltransferase complex ATPase subunit type 1 TsaE [Myxococcota bacterium]
MSWRSPGPEATAEAAFALARCIGDAGLVIALVGPLGAGKTAFVNGLAAGLGLDPARVASPTFVIASKHPAGARRLAHVDLYRVESEAELEAVGFLDLLEPGAVVAVEWADRFPGALPADRLELRIERPAGATEPGLRVLHATGSGPASQAALACWREALAALGATPPREEGGPPRSQA